MKRVTEGFLAKFDFSSFFPVDAPAIRCAALIIIL
jgi:hypothetical protein